MANIRDIQTDTDMAEFRECDSSVILMTPAWSAYPKKTLRTLEPLLPELAAKNIRFFTSTEDDPAENRSFANWISEHDNHPLRLLPMIATGSGSLVVCRYGKPIHFEPVTSHLTTDQLRGIILDAIEPRMP